MKNITDISPGYGTISTDVITSDNTAVVIGTERTNLKVTGVNSEFLSAKSSYESSSIYDGIECPNCHSRHFYVKGGYVTAMYFQPEIKDGVDINPDRNIHTEEFECCECHHRFQRSGNAFSGYVVKDLGEIPQPKPAVDISGGSVVELRERGKLVRVYYDKDGNVSQERDEKPNKKIEFCQLSKGAIKPTIGTKGSAGYDISIPSDYPEDIIIKPGEMVKINSGVAVRMPKGIVFMLYVRSSIGIKRGLVLANGTGVIDSDYFGNPSNGGEIILALRNIGDKEVELHPGERVVQGIFTPYLLTTEDASSNDDNLSERQGGIGSTNKE